MIERVVLKNKPLVEAIFELRWRLKETRIPGRSSSEAKILTDPKYRILIGRLYDKVKDEYPVFEELPTAFMPDDIAAYVIQHRFRKKEDGWPLIQMGPGIASLNDTTGYVWEDFSARAKTLLNVLYELHLDPENLEIECLVLRYIDAIDFDFQSDNILENMRDKMKVNISFLHTLFDGTNVNEVPAGIDLRFSFNCSDPKGSIHVRFVRGKTKAKQNKDALIWETIFQSLGNDAPNQKNEVVKWLHSAHDLAEDWFFKTIDGDLKKWFL